MSMAVKQILVALFFVAQMAATWYLGRPAVVDDTDVDPDIGQEKALARYGFHLANRSREAGLVFRHQIPDQLDSRLQHILPLVAMTGASVSIVDFDRDGLLDVFAVNSREGSECALFRNLGSGKFQDVTAEVGLTGLNREGSCQGAIWGDIDNDGYEDLLVYKWGRPLLFRNVGGKKFQDITEKSGLPPHSNANAAVWLDFDRDGHLDLFLSGYWPDGVDLWKLEHSRMMPESFQHAKNGGRKYLLRGRGDGTFEDVTEKMGITSTRWTLGVAAADLCGSGYPDLVLANDFGVSEYYCNKEGKRFEEVGAATGIGDRPKSGMSINFGDLFNTGRLAMYITNISDRHGNLNQGNNLWVPRKHEKGVPAIYDNMATDLRLATGGWSWGAQFGDLNNDGRLDLFMANGMISASKSGSYWYDYGKIAGANRAIILDAANWPAVRGRSLSGYERKCLWLNRGGEFADIAGPVGVKELDDGRAVALADLENRGALDVLMACQNGPLVYYRNTVKEGRSWVQLDLEGTRSNRSAIGAMVRLSWVNREGAHEQAQAVEGGNGYASQNMRRLHFGLGEDAKVTRAVIQWPSGLVQTLDHLEINRRHQIQEPKP
jgi:hypothetical protein